MKLNIRNFRNNALSGSIPDSIRNLNQLTYLDLSNNQLTGLFPEWVHSLTRLKLLNLGQNHFSGQIPVVIGGCLKNLREFFKFPQDWSGRRHKIYSALRESYREFLKAYYPWIIHSKDLFWLDSTVSWDGINLPESINAYIKAEVNHLTSRLFENIRSDPVHIVDLVDSTLKSSSVR
jgi:hypothetical protein